jgi:hypothetical protein
MAAIVSRRALRYRSIESHGDGDFIAEILSAIVRNIEIVLPITGNVWISILGDFIARSGRVTHNS